MSFFHNWINLVKILTWNCQMQVFHFVILKAVLSFKNRTGTFVLFSSIVCFY